ncbi:MAG: hypothetical protein ACOYXT_12640 [Bacteroidota bacterium]
MAKNALREVSVRFLEVLDELLEKEVVENMKVICKKLDYQPQSMSQIKNGKRDVTLQLVIKLYYEFGGNPIYVLLGDGNKILESSKHPSIPKNSVSLDSSSVERKYIKRLEDLVDSKIEIISLLKKEVERLQTQHGTKGK